ncbi:hypothetical protein [Dactylosporangium sp. NPDC051541]|uniref:hypothetical protein n=1 Tax=Dactylosporangium sp. NPDC051541 TaxID=3363977 RepID=UPI0037B10A72
MDLESRLLKLADSFAEQASRQDLDDFSVRVFTHLGLAVPSETVAETGGSDRPVRVGPPGLDGEHEGEQIIGTVPEEGVGRH